MVPENKNAPKPQPSPDENPTAVASTSSQKMSWLLKMATRPNGIYPKVDGEFPTVHSVPRPLCSLPPLGLCICYSLCLQHSLLSTPTLNFQMPPPVGSPSWPPRLGPSRLMRVPPSQVHALWVVTICGWTVSLVTWESREGRIQSVLVTTVFPAQPCLAQDWAQRWYSWNIC